MTSATTSGPVVTVKPQPNVYTILLIVAILFLATAVGFCLYNLMHNYGLTFGELFTGQKIPV